MNIREELLKAYGDGVIGHLEKHGAVLTQQEKDLVVLASWDGVWFGIKAGAVWATIVLGFLALFFR